MITFVITATFDIIIMSVSVWQDIRSQNLSIKFVEPSLVPWGFSQFLLVKCQLAAIHLHISVLSFKGSRANHSYHSPLVPVWMMTRQLGVCGEGGKLEINLNFHHFTSHLWTLQVHISTNLWGMKQRKITATVSSNVLCLHSAPKGKLSSPNKCEKT